MFRKANLQRVLAPAIVFFLVYMVVSFVTDEAITISTAVISCLIGEMLSYITCWAFVLVKQKNQKHVWANYFIWTILFCLGDIVSYLGN